MRGAHTEGANDTLPALFHLTTGRRPDPTWPREPREPTNLPPTTKWNGGIVDFWIVDCGEGRPNSSTQRRDGG